MSMNSRLSFIFLSALILGCGSGSQVPADRPVTHPVIGGVTYQGRPVHGATVTFVPINGSAHGAYARTDESGSFKLTTFETGDGAEEGAYNVMITKREVTGDPSYGDPDSPNYGKTPPPGAESKIVDLLPSRYGDAKTSGLVADVKAGENNFSFDLTD